MQFEGKTALVTGGASGIGLATVQALAGDGADVVLTDIDAAAGKSAAKACASLKGDVISHAQDVTDPLSWKRIFETAESKFGSVDILVNNAGIFEVGTVEDVNLEAWRRILSVNLDSVFLGTQTAIKHMKKTGGGSIVNVASIDGLVGHPLKAAYNASKGGVKQFTKSAALYCARMGYNIRINSLCPGYTMTPLVANAIPHAPEGLPEIIATDTPMGRFGTPEEIAKGVLFLASDNSSFMTGAELTIDGGYTAR